MRIRFEYPNIAEMHIKSISIVSNFNGYNSSNIIFIREAEKWYVELEVAKGMYHYKFLINECLYINDPHAQMYCKIGEEIWSSIQVEDNQDSDNNANNDNKGIIKYRGHIVTNRLSNLIQAVAMQKEFYIPIDKKVVLGVEWDPVIGLHEVVVIWSRPDATIHHIAYETLEADSYEEVKAALSWFWLKLDDKGREYVPGIWTVMILVDGRMVISDRFKLHNRIGE